MFLATHKHHYALNPWRTLFTSCRGEFFGSLYTASKDDNYTRICIQTVKSVGHSLKSAPFVD